MYLDVYERDTSRYIHDTCKIHRIRILITNPPKFDKTPVTHPTPLGGFKRTALCQGGVR